MLQVPGLAVLIVGNRKDSQSYVGMKRKACAELGIKSFDVDLPEQVSQAELIKQVHQLNANPDVHGSSLITLFYYLFPLQFSSHLSINLTFLCLNYFTGLYTYFFFMHVLF